MAQNKPNIISLSCHDLGQHVGCYGVRTVSTPNIDRLAAEGVRFARSFCVAPQCSPSRATTYTGRFPHSNGVMGLVHGIFGWDLYPEERHLAGILRDAGWYSALLGGQHETAHPERMGCEVLTPQFTRPLECTVLAEQVAEFLKRQQGQERPFYLQLGFSEPHRKFDRYGTPPDSSLGVTIPPYLVDEPSAREEFASFQGAIRKVDGAIGRVLAALDEYGLRDNTLVMFFADHGIPFPRAKGALTDPGLEVCLIMRWPAAGWTPGTVYQELTTNADYLPTALDLAGVPVPARVQGRSFAPLLRGEPYQPHTEIFGELTYHEYYDPRRCLRTATHKLVVNFCVAPEFMNLTQSWRPKTITRYPPDPAYAHHPTVELYDLTPDPLESVNLAQSEEHRAVRQDLLRRLHRWMQETDDPLLGGIPPSPMHRWALDALAGGE
ncbi:MAG: sulfatase [Anaerolineae bacterium]|nr:sulfatase [Anaerolineae bacterium]